MGTVGQKVQKPSLKQHCINAEQTGKPQGRASRHYAVLECDTVSCFHRKQKFLATAGSR